jgi:hypothetical protein
MKIDFHVHTHASLDSTINPKHLAKKSKELGIIPTIADHTSIDSWKKMKAADCVFIPAEEIRTGAGDLIGLFLTELVPSRLSFEESVDRIRAQGGLAYLPHMYDAARRGCGHGYAEAADIIEIFNGRCIGNANQLAEARALQLGKPGAAGSDSHFLFEFGFTYTELPDFAIDDPKKMLKSLKSKDVKLVTKSSPIYVRGVTDVLSKVRKVWRRMYGK